MTLVETKISKTLEKDVFSVAYGLMKMNAGNVIGYLFDTIDNKKVYRGMFCNWKSEIEEKQWDYYYEYISGKFYKINR